MLIRANCMSLLRDAAADSTAQAVVRALTPARKGEIVSVRRTYPFARMWLASLLRGLLDRTVEWYQKSGSLSPAELPVRSGEGFRAALEHRAAPWDTLLVRRGAGHRYSVACPLLACQRNADDGKRSSAPRCALPPADRRVLFPHVRGVAFVFEAVIVDEFAVDNQRLIIFTVHGAV